jgi:hypothetical protein
MIFSAPEEASPPSPLSVASFASRVGRFASVQMLVQAVGFASGILLVRELDQHQYALFTVANTMQGAMNVLGDIGISIGVISIGGRVWQDRERFGELIRTGLSLRRRLGALAAVAVVPALYYMLTKNGASPIYALALAGAVILALTAQLSIGVLEVVPRLRSDIRLIQKIDLTGALVRLAAIAILLYLYINAGIAVLIGSGVLLLQFLLLRRYAREVVNLDAPENPEDRTAMLGYIRQQAANAIFFCLQGQITVFLITIFGRHIQSVAEIGALGRLAMIYTVMANLIMNIFAPAFARCQESGRLKWIYAGIVGAVAGFSLLVLVGAALFPREFLFVLGTKYGNLEHELLLMIGGAALNMLASSIWYLNASRAWITGAWLYIPLTILTQILLIPFINFSTVSGVLTFNLLSALPSLGLNLCLSYRGFLQAAHSSQIHEPDDRA